MKRAYSRIVSHGWNDEGQMEGCLAWITYFLADGTVGRNDYYDPKDGLFKVSYRQLEPPYGAALEEHWKDYPGVMCEFATPAVLIQDSTRLVSTRLYLPGNVLDRQYEVYVDENGRTVKQIRIGPDGRRIQEERPVYDDKGRQIGTEFYSAAGKFLYRALDDD